MPTQYLLDPAWHAERDRLNSLTQLYDPGTMALIGRLNLPPGARCAEIGAGTGSVAELIARHVGPDGQVLVIDTDTRFLDPLADATITVARQDVTATPLPRGQFDLIHARLLLEHLPQRDDVLASLAEGLAPGGWLLVEDLDWATAEVIDPPSPVYNRVTGACREFMRSRGYDPEYARRLPQVPHRGRPHGRRRAGGRGAGAGRCRPRHPAMGTARGAARPGPARGRLDRPGGPGGVHRDLP